MEMMPKKLQERIETAGIIAVLVIDDPDSAVPLARTLLDNGISAMELTLRTDAALESLKRIRSETPDMLAGIGTILKPAQVIEVKAFNADFGVAPGCNKLVLEAARSAELPFAPGISTPSDIENALEYGCRILKFFHAEGMGGGNYLKGISSPYNFLDLRYIPLGGLKPSNIIPYLEMPEVMAIGGSWIARRNLLKDRDWVTIGNNAAEAVKILNNVRGRA